MSDNRPLSLPAPAKLNLFLHITGRRDDGYHELQTVFQLLDVGDRLDLQRREDGELHLTMTGSQSLDGLAANDNLVLRAAHALRDAAGDPQLGADLVLDKQLPSGGGLGGGSSDAATTLLGLNALWGLEMSVDALADLGSRLGADVPVFVRGHSAWAEGVGERLTPVELPERWFVVIHPGCHIATGEIFSHPELTRDSAAITIAAFFAGPSRNDCEKLVRRLADPVDKALIFLQKFGGGRMTGTGACVFMALESEREAQRVKAQVPDGWHSFVARGMNRSTAWEQLRALKGAPAD